MPALASTTPTATDTAAKRVIGAALCKGRAAAALRRGSSISRADDRIKNGPRLPNWHARGVPHVTRAPPPALPAARGDGGPELRRSLALAAPAHLPHRVQLRAQLVDERARPRLGVLGRPGAPLGGVVQLDELAERPRARIAARLHPRRELARRQRWVAPGAASREQLRCAIVALRDRRADADAPRRRHRQAARAPPRAPAQDDQREPAGERDREPPPPRRPVLHGARRALDPAPARLERVAQALEQLDLRRQVVLDHPLRPLEPQRVDQPAEPRAPPRAAAAEA